MVFKRVFAAFWFFLFTVLPVQASNHGDPRRGAELAQQCVSCHGVDGNNNTEGFPSLSNQKYRYLVKQMREMRNSAKIRAGEKTYDTEAAQAIMRSRRTNEIMDPFVVHLSDADIEDLSAYYAAEPCRAHDRGRRCRRPDLKSAVRSATASLVLLRTATCRTSPVRMPRIWNSSCAAFRNPVRRKATGRNAAARGSWKGRFVI